MGVSKRDAAVENRKMDSGRGDAGHIGVGSGGTFTTPWFGAKRRGAERPKGETQPAYRTHVRAQN